MFYLQLVFAHYNWVRNVWMSIYTRMGAYCNNMSLLKVVCGLEKCVYILSWILLFGIIKLINLLNSHTKKKKIYIMFISKNNGWRDRFLTFNTDLNSTYCFFTRQYNSSDYSTSIVQLLPLKLIVYNMNILSMILKRWRMKDLKSYLYRFQLFISEFLYCIIIIDTIYYLLTVCGWLYINFKMYKGSNRPSMLRNVNAT